MFDSGGRQKLVYRGEQIRSKRQPTCYTLSCRVFPVIGESGIYSLEGVFHVIPLLSSSKAGYYLFFRFAKNTRDDEIVFG